VETGGIYGVLRPRRAEKRRRAREREKFAKKGFVEKEKNKSEAYIILSMSHGGGGEYAGYTPRSEREREESAVYKYVCI